MQAIISPGNISGSIMPPPSKSMMQRVCAAALLHKGKTIITNPGIAADDKAALNIIKTLGATVNQIDNNSIEIISKGILPIDDIIHCGESGLAARLFTPIAALYNQQLTITGQGSLLTRPMEVFSSIFPPLGVRIESSNGRLPLTVQGPLEPKDITVDGAVSSQFLSGLLFAYAFAVTNPVTITVNNLKSKPYIDLTLDVLRHFGKIIEHTSYQTFHINPSHFKVVENDIEINIEADWSAAANFIVAKSIAGNIEINNLNNNSLQADKAIMSVVIDTKAAFDFDATDCPDLIPILSVYAAVCNGASNVHGLQRLVHKESNRIDSIANMLTKLGVSFNASDNTLTITGGKRFESCTIDSYNDHRIVMAAAISALYAKGDITITHAEAVDKSYPHFFKDLAAIGVKCILNYE